MTKPPDVDELLGPSRNFSISTDERVKGLGGLPAHLRRLGRIEQMSERAKVIAARVRARQEPHEALDALVRTINVLIEAHNLYFPIEANRPIDRKTGLPLHGDAPFRKRPLLSSAELLRG